MLPNYLKKGRVEAGCDEAGRGCLAGPVFAAAVILPKDVLIVGLDDSKKLSEKKRLELREIIMEKAIAFAVARVEPEEIDQINILNASFKAMHLAVDRLGQKPEHLLIDGNRFNPYPDIPHSCVIKGDGKYASIAAASILAKTFRDEYMKKIAVEYPQYGWEQNRGYATLKHRQAIKRYGFNSYHRKSFTVK